jgi:hypothetical protein
MNPTMIYYNDQSYMKPSEKTNVLERPKYIEIKHYILYDEVQKRESGCPIYISTDEQIRRYFGKASFQNERVCVFKLELVETTSLLKKEEMTPKLGGSTDVLCLTTQVFQQRTNTFSNHSHNQIKDQHTDVFTW